jgi:hypothetical protein
MGPAFSGMRPVPMKATLSLDICFTPAVIVLEAAQVFGGGSAATFLLLA